MSNIKFSDLPVSNYGIGDTTLFTVNDNIGVCKITADDITMADGTSLKDMAAIIRRQEEARKAVELKAKQEAEEKAIGAVAVALTGAGAIANKNPVISRRFWRG